MFESAPTSTAALQCNVRAVVEALSAFDGRGSEAAELERFIADLERLKCVAEGAQVVAAAGLDRVTRQAQAACGVPAERRGQGVALQVALARRESHHRGARHLGLARVLAAELPCTLAALRRGDISEWRATLVARETACLSRESRADVDQALGDPGGLQPVLTGAGERELVGELRRATYRLDPASVVARRRRAESERTVTLRPAPDTMTYLTALLPVAEGVAALAALTSAAATARSDGDPRSRGQVMADLLVTRLLGQPDGQPAHVPVTINVVVSDAVLLAGTDGTAEIDGYGPVPGALARHLAAAPSDARVALRRLYARPSDGALVAMESTSRRFPTALATLVRLRDRTCRTPWCDAPVRHTDHVRPAADDGPTSAANAQGLCEACNHAKQASGWRQHVVDRSPPGRHEVLTTTPTGVRYRSTAPPAPAPAILSPVEIYLDQLRHAA